MGGVAARGVIAPLLPRLSGIRSVLLLVCSGDRFDGNRDGLRAESGCFWAGHRAGIGDGCFGDNLVGGARAADTRRAGRGRDTWKIGRY
jgi:hypothetical protein